VFNQGDWLNIRTGYSFKSAFGKIENILKQCGKFAGIADIESTYGHIRWNEACKAANIKPVFGVRLNVSDLHPKGEKVKRYRSNEFTLIASTTSALQEIYQLVDLSYQQFYQFPKINYEQLNNTSNEIIVLSGIAPELTKIKRKVYLQLSPDLPALMRDTKLEPVACIDNFYPKKKDKIIYESLVYGQFTGENKTTPMHILTDDEWLSLFPDQKKALKNKYQLLEMCSGVELPFAPMVKYNSNEDPNELLKKLCKKWAKEKGLDKGIYKERMKRELEVIKEKNFADYFLIVSDLLEYCKTVMAVGPARGSSAGSLVCYLIGITEIDPIKYDLLFERFIDINRSDWPDIDFDLQDTKRDLAIKYLQQKYGNDCVAQIANINKLQPKSAIIRVAKALNIPAFAIEAFKDSIEDRPEGDSRASSAISDAFKKSKIGRETLDEFPNLYHVKHLEGHPSHLSIHAAGLIVCPVPINKFCGVNSREKQNIAMVDKRDAEKVNLLKIDALGLTTLSVLAEVCDQLGKSYSWMYSLPLDDKKTFKLINKGSLSGIFQMEGETLKNLAKGMKIRTIEEIADLGALCRPGPLGSGAAARYVKQKSGKEDVQYLSNSKTVVEWTKTTMGNIVYQEQLMGIVKDYACLPWSDVIKIRKLMGKSQGDEAFSEFKEKFVKGAVDNGAKKKEAEKIWEEMKNFGKYGFNKSHAIAYSIITYLTAYFKANYPLEFAVAILNHTNNNNTALKILRELYENEGIEHVPFDVNISEKKWIVYRGKLYGGLTTIEGIGPRNADIIIKCRETKRPVPPGIAKAVDEGYTPFKYLYPGQSVYGDFYSKKSKFGKATLIKDIQETGNYVFIGMLTKKEIRDLNDTKMIIKRGGETVNGPSAYLTMQMEDDSDSISVSIGRYHFEELSDVVTEDSQVNKDWFVVFGKLANPENRRVYVEDIRKITRKY